MTRLSNLPPGVTDRMIEEQANPQPFDPGYDYEADKDICERLSNCLPPIDVEWSAEDYLVQEAAATIRTLRLMVATMERTINGLIAERNADEDES